MSSLQKKLLDEESLVESEVEIHPEKPGWKAMPYILGNDTTERLATFGMQANFMVYLWREYNMDQVFAANILNNWSVVSNVVPLLGAFVADAYLGNFLTIGMASFASLLGTVIIMLTARVPQFHPPPCPIEQQQLGVCKGHTNFQLSVLFFGLFWLAIGTGGIRPCSIPFAIDQFDLTTVEGRQGSTRFYNIYYITQTLVLLINQSALVYIQDSVSWTLGFGLPCLRMFISIILFFYGTNVYACVKPEGSIFSGIAQVLVAAKHKCHLHLPAAKDTHGAFYDLPVETDAKLKLPLTNDFRCLNKAALMEENELNRDGTIRNPWRLCSVQQVEEFKCLLKIIPIWLTSIIVYIPAAQASIFPISQALKMDRNLLPNFEIPAGSISVITMVTVGLFLPFYDQFFSPALAKIISQEEGLTTLQRMGIGHAFAITTMLLSGLVEIQRRALETFKGAHMSIMWLAPQFITTGISQMFATVALTEFLNNESPHGMRSIVNSLLCLQVAAASNVRNLIVDIVHNFSGKHGQPDWLDDDINKGRLENFYFIIAALGVVNMSYFIFCARRYRYKITVRKAEKNFSIQ